MTNSELYDAAFDYDVERVRRALATGAAAAEGLHAVCWLGDAPSDNTIEQSAEAVASGDSTSGSTKCVRIIELLLAAGADVNAVDANGDTPLHRAVGGDWANAAAVRELLRRGALIDPLNARGETPLMVAVAPGPHQTVHGGPSKVACVEMLLTAGAASSARVVMLAADTALWAEALVAAGPVVHFRPSAEKLARAERRLHETLASARQCVALVSG